MTCHLRNACGAVVLDLDGTLWRGEEPIEGAVDFWDQIISRGVPVVLLSNTGERCASDVAVKFCRVMRRRISNNQIWTALDNIDNFLQEEHSRGRISRVHVIAPARNIAWKSCRFAAWAVSFQASSVVNVQNDAIIFASDGPCDGDYHATLSAVATQVERGVRFYATSDDTTITLATEHGIRRLAGPGVFVGGVRAMLDQACHERIVSFGKGTSLGMPAKALELLRRQKFSGHPRQVRFVGDRLDADMRAAYQVGSIAVHVESGCHNVAQYTMFPADVPHVAASNVAELTGMLGLGNFASDVHNSLRDAMVTASRRLQSRCVSNMLRTTEYFDSIAIVPPRRIQSLPDMATLSAMTTS